MTREELIETMARGMAGANYDLDGEEQLSWVVYTHEARGALTAIEAAGMRVVPVVPSKMMLEAADEYVMICNEKEFGPTTGGVYVAMLAAQEDSTSE